MRSARVEERLYRMRTTFPLIIGRLYITRQCAKLSAASISGGVHVGASNGRPPPSGERGRRERNYQRSQARKERTGAARDKEIDVQSLLKNMRETGSQSADTSTSLKDVLAGIKFHIPPNEVTRRKLGLPPRSPLTRPEKEVARLRRERLPENSIHPSAGPRLGVFGDPGPDTQLLPPAPPNLAEREHAELVASMQSLRPTNQFQQDMTDVAFPRQFPIDNETAKNEEEGVGFEDHVLLNHLLKGFPSRGPVRHFIEMVVTGLSKNPHYSAREKREHVQWYRDYFAQSLMKSSRPFPPPLLGLGKTNSSSVECSLYGTHVQK
ncbi:28S ribosomal protein S31, mitochondrial [Geodia barretti]|uniref:Small ribosomal subunit protein mS31 n=1 Tax=Geodia barretti TaxID=519541 RepID=A0AA35QRQ0_GEOBA|nr:28S ribosomal protein S31, mitochondrial [Geodia barretti]